MVHSSTQIAVVITQWSLWPTCIHNLKVHVS